MRISTQNSQFIFNFPSWFFASVEEDYSVLLRKNRVQYENVVDYMNSTIKEIEYPGININTVSQELKFGKEKTYLSSQNDTDLNERKITITFRDVDSKINWFIMYKAINNYYINTGKENYFGPLSITVLDYIGDAIFKIKFRQCMLLSLSGTKFAYADQSVEEKTFSIEIKYNFFDILFDLGETEPSDDVLLREQFEPLTIFHDKNQNLSPIQLKTISL